MIGQVDAFRYAQVFYSNLVPVAAPHYDTDRCSGPNYRALVLVREDDPVQAWTDLQQKILAVDGLDLLGSWRLFKAFVAGVTDPAAFFGRVIISGGALETLTLVRSGATDYAVLDCVTAALIRDTEPAHLDGIRILAETDQGLAPPFVTAASRSAGERDRLLAALVAAFSDPGLDEILERLRLRSIEPADPIAYAFEPRPVESTVTLLSTARSQRES